MEVALSASDVVQHYAEGERNFREVDIERDWAAFRGHNLRGIDFSQAIVVGDFRGADLRDARFVNTNIKTSDFRGADD